MESLTKDTFDEFLHGSSREAVARFRAEYERTKDVFVLNNLGLALLDVADWQQARDVYATLKGKKEHVSDFELIGLGMAEWFMGHEVEAIQWWREACEADYTDAAGAIDGPLVLWYAGQRLGDEKLVKESLNKLKKFWKVQDYRIFSKWPGTIAIAGFLLGKVPANMFLYEWKWPNLEDRRLCRANFWVGMKHLEDGDETAGAAYFKSAFSGAKIAILEYEYFLAKWEYSLTREPVNP